MPTFLSDPATSTYTILGAMVLILAAVAMRRQKKADFAMLAAGVALLLGLFLADHFNDSPRETTLQHVQAMALASQSKNWDDLFKHVSESFKYKTLDKKTIRDKAKLAESMIPDGFETWELQRSNFKEIDETTLEQSFLAQPRKSGNPAMQRYVVATFKKEGDAWKMIEFKLYHPLQRTNAPEESVPGL